MPIYILRGSADEAKWSVEHQLRRELSLHDETDESEDVASPRSIESDDIASPRRLKQAPSHDEPAAAPHREPIRIVEETVVTAHDPHEAINRAAATGDMQTIERYARMHKDVLLKKDTKGWEPIHFAAKSGSMDAVQFFLFNGANINERTYDGLSALGVALEIHGRGPFYDNLLESRLGAEL